MAYSTVAVLFLIVFVAHPFIASAYDQRETEAKWRFFLKKYHKTYATEQESQQRFQIFSENLNRIRMLQSTEQGTAVYGVTAFADMTAEEFRQARLMPSFDVGEAKNSCLAHGVRMPALRTDPAPTSVDWRDKNAVTPVKNQGGCGSCWAFSTTGNIESQWFLAGNPLVSLSEQQIVDCDHTCSEVEKEVVCDSGCMGGWPWAAMYGIMELGGVMEETAYPYTARDGTCKFNESGVVAKIANYTCLPTDETEIAAYVAQNGPVSIALNAGHLQFYRHGISDPLLCDAKRLDHAVLMVGYGSESGHDFWIVKNSWGKNWGEDGYFRLARGKGKCGCNNAVSSALIHQ